MGGSYVDQVLGTGPIAYWPLDEGGGTVARCLVNTAQNGVATGVTWANDATGPFGTPAPYFDGANDYINVKTATLDAAFNGSTGTVAFWMKVANAGVWTDAADRAMVYLSEDGNNFYSINKHSANNELRWRVNCAGVFNGPVTAQSSIAWLPVAMTWEWGGVNTTMYRYTSGAQDGAPFTVAAQYVGNLAAVAVIGAAGIAPSGVFHGWMAHAALWDRVLSADEILGLANP